MKKQVICLSVLSTLVFGAAPMSPSVWAKSEEMQLKTTIIDSKGVQVGTAVLTQKGDAVQIHVEAKNLPPGEHGFHFHETGKCDPPDFMSAGPHFNPQGKQHGFKNPKGFHAGDLFNLLVKEDGTVTADLESKTVTLKKGVANSLLKEGGTALMIHEKADDYVTDPTGNSGARIACSVIQ
ncbi:superoxide dismutase family protein [Paenibacillus sp. KQZ6P-2]|uniref:Superoxide dismutase [Cu-Zn] n=1 Tax=Paenibacillus mangrovi TaxID=2931978 RepID=A0A9X1WUN6_9BACL|nr:superoxide dismutase family protein [Paenibacillus mangrovi]MCJ8014916.1 superoxide dismutase family protein [Paenibacillus mangrovi]